MQPLLLLVLAQNAVTPVDQCSVRVESRTELARLFASARDVDDHDPVDDGFVRVYADRREQQRLRDLGFELTVVQPDLARFYAERAASTSSVLGAGSMGGFRTLAEIGAEMDRLATTYPAIVSAKYSLGNTVAGRPIWAMRISDNPTIDEVQEPVAWFDALQHAREPMGGESLLMLADWLCTHYASDAEVRRMVDTRNIVLVPCSNPDGYEHNRQTDPGGGGLWRKNRRANAGGSFGVDINRNWGWEWGPQWPGSSGDPTSDTYRGTSAFSEPETRALRDALLAHPPGMAMSTHTFGNLWLFPWGYDSVLPADDARFRQYSQLMTATNGYTFGPPWQVLYVANGGAFDWGYGQLGTFFFSAEIGDDNDGFWPAPTSIPSLFEDVREPYLDIVRWTGAWPRVTAVAFAPSAGDGDDSIEPGERWRVEVELENGGVLPANGTLTLASSSPDVTVVHAAVPFDTAAGTFALTATPGGPQQRAAHQIVPLEVELAPGAALASYTLQLGVSFDGVTSLDTIQLRLGAARRLALDDMEIASFGWQATGDAPNYTWQRAVPQGTTTSGEQAQPPSDNSSVGTQCWVTGSAAGSGAGSNDVDGTTRLVSPRLWLGSFAHIELEYARWFANIGASQDDQLLVELSNDDGATWTLVESVTNDNAWRTHSVELGDFLALNDRMRLRFTAADVPNNDVTEAALDDLVLTTTSVLPTLGVWGATNAGAGVRLFVDGGAALSYRVRTGTAVSAGLTQPGVQGLYYLAGTITEIASGTCAADGRAVASWTVPTSAPIYVQVLIDEGGPSAAWSNVLRINTP